MRVVLLGDLHGNWPATEAMAAAVERAAPDFVWFLGDAVGKGPDSDRTCDWVRAHCDGFIGGNWDWGIGRREFPNDAFFWEQLGEKRLAWLSSLPGEASLTLSGVRFRLFHGRPLYPLMRAQDDEALLAQTFRNAAGEVFDGVIFADSHRPFIRTLAAGYILNTGSVGNSTAVPKAHALLLEGGESASDELRMSVLSVPYDNARAAEDARRKTGLPHSENYIREVLTGQYTPRQ